MDTALLIVAFTVLTTALVVITAIGYLVYRTAISDGVLPAVSAPRLRPSRPGRDEYTPQDADGTLPLDQFTPDPSRPLTYKVRDEGDKSIIEEVPEE